MFTRTKKTLTQVNLDKKKVIDSCVQLVTSNGRPFALLDDSGFRMIMNPIFDAIGDGFRINSQNIKKHVNEYAITIIENITRDIDKKLISLKVDCVTRLNRSIIGVNIQYFKDLKLFIKTIGMTELTERHTSEHLKKVLIQILKKFKIENRQVFSITCDNGANIVKMVRIFNDNEVNTDNSDCEEGENIILNDDEERLSNDQVDDMINAPDLNLNAENLEQDVATILNPNYEPLLLTQCIRCSAHTLQLCIDHGLKQPANLNILIKARKVVKTLRTPSYVALLKKDHLKQAMLDNVTRWSSKYLMLVRLIELKTFCEDHQQINNDLKLNGGEWRRIECLITSLEPLNVATKMLQRRDLTIGDFYGIWIQTKNKLLRINSTLSTSILNEMKTREVQLLENDIFISAVFMDPRYRCLLTVLNQEKAVNHLLKIWELKELLNCTEKSEVVAIDEPIDNDITNEIIDENDGDDFEKFLSNNSNIIPFENSQVLSSSQCSNGSSRLKTLLEEYSKLARVNYKEDVVQFWIEKKDEMPELFELATILLAVPATQVSVERSFSGLKFILSDQRGSIGNEILENILIIRGNSD